MLSPERRNRMKALIGQLKTCSTLGNVESSYNAMKLACKLYASMVDGISDCLEESEQYSGTTCRNADVVAEMLTEYLLIEKETDDYFASTMQALAEYPKAQALYQAGLSKYASDLFERNTLDDMRAALEALVKYITGNAKTLENQIAPLGQKLELLTRPVIRNMFVKVIEYYTKYQNDYVKHDDAVDPSEVSFVMELTSALMRYLIQTLGGNENG